MPAIAAALYELYLGWRGGSAVKGGGNVARL